MIEQTDPCQSDYAELFVGAYYTRKKWSRK